MAERRAFADKTTVPVEETVATIRKLVAANGGAQFVFGLAEDRLLIGFTASARQVRFQVPQTDQEQRNRSLARALLLAIKAKFEVVAAGISVFEDEFLANIVLPDGTLVGQQSRASIAAAYEGRAMPALLPDYSGTPA